MACVKGAHLPKLANRNAPQGIFYLRDVLFIRENSVFYWENRIDFSVFAVGFDRFFWQYLRENASVFSFGICDRPFGFKDGGYL